jgi:hypothetical protein
MDWEGSSEERTDSVVKSGTQFGEEEEEDVKNLVIRLTRLSALALPLAVVAVGGQLTGRP